MATVGPHSTVVDVLMGDCPACKKLIFAKVTASVSVTAVGTKATSGSHAVVTLHTDKVEIEHARISHDCGPQVEEVGK